MGDKDQLNYPALKAFRVKQINYEKILDRFPPKRDV